MVLRLDPEQKFTCRSCGQCCRRSFDIVLTQAESDRLEAANASRWFRESSSSPPGTEVPPFEHLTGGFLRIRKRADGVCGFLSDENRCRIHEELGGTVKPLSCQMFPYSFDPVGGVTRVSMNLCCPTVLRNDGRPIEDQRGSIGALATRWRKANSPVDVPLEWVQGVPLQPELLESMRWTLRRLLDLHDEPYSLRRNVGRMAALVEDWTRHRVTKLDTQGFEEYVKLTGGYAVTKPVEPKPLRSRLASFLFRGFFFAAAVPWASRGVVTGAPLRLRLRLLRLLLHVHGIGASFQGLRFGAGRRQVLDIDSEPFFGPAYQVLRVALENLGTGRRPVVEELSLAVGCLLVAEHLYLSRSNKGDPASAWLAALMDAHDVTHVDPRSRFGRILVGLAAPPSPLHLFASRA
jgi:Fe-S-cluster containining protein